MTANRHIGSSEIVLLSPISIYPRSRPSIMTKLSTSTPPKTKANPFDIIVLKSMKSHSLLYALALKFSWNLVFGNFRCVSLSLSAGTRPFIMYYRSCLVAEKLHEKRTELFKQI